MIGFLFDFGPLAIFALLGGLIYLGWWRKQIWARVVAIVLIVLLLGGAVAFGLFAYAMGQANWSL